MFGTFYWSPLCTFRRQTRHSLSSAPVFHSMETAAVPEWLSNASLEQRIRRLERNETLIFDRLDILRDKVFPLCDEVQKMQQNKRNIGRVFSTCLLYTSDAADE